METFIVAIVFPFMQFCFPGNVFTRQLQFKVLYLFTNVHFLTLIKVHVSIRIRYKNKLVIHLSALYVCWFPNQQLFCHDYHVVVSAFDCNGAACQEQQIHSSVAFQYEITRTEIYTQMQEYNYIRRMAGVWSFSAIISTFRYLPIHSLCR